MRFLFQRRARSWLRAFLAAAMLSAGALCVRAQETEGGDTVVVLGDVDLAERAEIARNLFRRITPGDGELVQDAGTWPAAWEEFGAAWDEAAAEREFGAWAVPVEVSQESGATVVRDGTGRELWRGTTDFAKPESAGVVLTGALVGEEEWAGYEAVKVFVEANTRLEAASPMGASPRGGATNGLRFTSAAVDTNGTVSLSLAWEQDGVVDIFAYGVPHDPAIRVLTWTNDENIVVTTTNTIWTQTGANLIGYGNDWEWRGTVAVTNGEGFFADEGIPDYLSIVRFYAAVEATDSDGDRLNDGVERFVRHTDPESQDTDGDGVPDGSDPYPAASNVFWTVTTTNTYLRHCPRPNCTQNAPAVHVATEDVVGVRPTTDSVVHDVTVTGFVDDAIKVDGTGVDWRRDIHTFDHRSITNEIADLQGGQFELELWDWPRADYEGPNEARLGDANGVPFKVEWTWKVPVEVTLEAVYSGQLPGRMCNEAGGGSPMCMATRSNDWGYLTVAASVYPSELPVVCLVGVRHGSDVLASAVIQDPVTMIAFAPAGGRELYDVLAGVDMNGDGVLQSEETTVVLENAVRLLNHSDYTYSCSLLSGAAGVAPGIGSHLLQAFLNDSIPAGVITSTVALTAEELTHGVGAVWSFDCDATTRMYIYGQSTDVATAVGEDSAVVNTVKTALESHSAEVASWFATNSVGVHVFGPWEWGGNGVELDGLGLSLAFGHVNPTGTMSVAVRRSDLKVMNMTYEGQFTDVYDFSYTGAYPSAHGATVQAGFSTWGQSGRVFKVRVEFSCDTEEFDYSFGTGGGVAP